MDFRVWKENIVSNLKILSDLEFQERSWIRGEEFGAGWHDQVADLYGSNVFLDFLKQPELTNQAKAKLLKFHLALDAYQGHETDLEVLRDPQWHQIARLAGEALDELLKQP